MQFYATDNLNTYFFVCFTEHYEHISSESDSSLSELQIMMNIIDDISSESLKEWIYEYVNTYETGISVNFRSAILGSIDYEDMKIKLREWASYETCDECLYYTGGGDCDHCAISSDNEHPAPQVSCLHASD